MRGLFSDYFDGELTADDTSTFEHLLEEDAVFRKEYESYASIFNQVRALPSVSVSDSFETRLKARIRREAPLKGRSWWSDFARIPLPVPLGAAALVLVGVFGYGLLLQGSGQAPDVLTPAASDRVAEAAPSTGAEPERVTNTRPVFAPNLTMPGVGRMVGADFASPAPSRLSSPHQFQRDDYGIPLEGPFRTEAFRQTAPRSGARAASERAKTAPQPVDTSQTR